MTEQQLIKKIIQDAEKQAADLIATAEAQSRNKIAAAQIAADQHQAEAIQQAKDRLARRQAEQMKAQEVELIKAQINAKQNLIQQVFDQVRTNLLHAPANEVKTLVTTLTKKYAHPGDTIMVGSAWAKAMPNLPVTKQIDAGIIIENQTYRLELSIDAILAELRPQLAPTVAKMIGVL